MGPTGPGAQCSRTVRLYLQLTEGANLCAGLYNSTTNALMMMVAMMVMMIPSEQGSLFTSRETRILKNTKVVEVLWELFERPFSSGSQSLIYPGGPVVRKRTSEWAQAFKNLQLMLLSSHKGHLKSH